MTSIFEQLGGTYTEGSDGMLYPNLTLDPREHRPIGRWGRMQEFIWKQNIPACMIG